MKCYINLKSVFFGGIFSGVHFANSQSSSSGALFMSFHMSGWLTVRGTSKLGDLDLTQLRWRIMKMDKKKKKTKHSSRSMNVLSALCCWKPRVESLPHNWPESLIITHSWGAACVSDCVSASISTSLLVFSTVFLCVCVYRKFDTPTPFWMKRVLRERRVQPTTWQGRRGVLGWGRMEGQGGWRVAAARILKETVGEWGGLSPLVTSQHAQPREFAFLDSQSQSTPCKTVCRMTQCSYLVVADIPISELSYEKYNWHKLGLFVTAHYNLKNEVFKRRFSQWCHKWTILGSPKNNSLNTS